VRRGACTPGTLGLLSAKQRGPSKGSHSQLALGSWPPPAAAAPGTPCTLAATSCRPESPGVACSVWGASDSSTASWRAGWLLQPRCAIQATATARAQPAPLLRADAASVHGASWSGPQPCALRSFQAHRSQLQRPAVAASLTESPQHGRSRCRAAEPALSTGVATSHPNGCGTLTYYYASTRRAIEPQPARFRTAPPAVNSDRCNLRHAYAPAGKTIVCCALVGPLRWAAALGCCVASRAADNDLHACIMMCMTMCMAQAAPRAGRLTAPHSTAQHTLTQQVPHPGPACGGRALPRPAAAARHAAAATGQPRNEYWEPSSAACAEIRRAAACSLRP
jgi:hypothetical protein